MAMLTFFASIKQKITAYPIRHFIIKLVVSYESDTIKRKKVLH